MPTTVQQPLPIEQREAKTGIRTVSDTPDEERYGIGREGTGK
jgi:hypothetical protein